MKVFSWNDVVRGAESRSAASLGLASDSNCATASLGPSAVTVGGFDGMHLGHQALFDAVFEWKEKRARADLLGLQNVRGACLTGAVTFTRSPGAFKSESYPGDLMTERMKLEFLEKRGFDFCVMIDFSEDFSKIVGRNFLDQLRKFCSAQFLAAGSDFRCGHNLDTGVAELADYATQNGLELKVLDDVTLDKKRVSSSLIRGAVLEGDFALAKKLLGFPYRIDCSRLEWRASSSDSSLSLIANGRTTQVLPKAGRHPVSVVFAGKKSSAFFCAEGQFLRLEFPLGQKGFSSVQEIEFL
ncbi:MAG: FAD synthetase family protein [Treponema sp.]|nr:FAD synthetase family protein [Treponema sp.]MEE3436240.1 FAD synthetase family protein [Treponema sp.]